MTGSGMRPLDRPCSEQGKQPTAKAFKLAERDKHMSEQEKLTFMQELDLWIEDAVIFPLLDLNDRDDVRQPETVEKVHRDIRAKVLQSYRNGQAMGPRQPAQDRRKGAPAMSWAKR